jgi:hypothetical protein
MATRTVLALLLVIAAGVGIGLVLRRPPPPIKAAAVVLNYDSYVYGRSEEAKILDFGTQPFGTPATFIAECLFHDRVLQRQLTGDSIGRERFSQLIIPGYLETIKISVAADKKPRLRIMRQVISPSTPDKIIAVLVGECAIEGALRSLIGSVNSL